MITKHHCAVLVNKDTFDSGYTCTPIQVSCTPGILPLPFEGMVVTGKFRRPPDPCVSVLHSRKCAHQQRVCKKAIRGRALDPSCSDFTVANVHINNECAKPRSVCIALLLLVRDLCLKLGEVVLTGAFKKGAARELPSGGSDDQHRISPLEAAFSFAAVPWPTSGVTLLWAPAASSTGNKCPECCGFNKIPKSQNK